MTEKQEGTLAKAAKNKQTTAGAILAVLALAAVQAQYQWDGDPETVAQWGLLIPAVMAAIAFFFAADASKATPDA